MYREMSSGEGAVGQRLFSVAIKEDTERWLGSVRRVLLFSGGVETYCRPNLRSVTISAFCPSLVL